MLVLSIMHLLLDRILIRSDELCTEMVSLSVAAAAAAAVLCVFANKK